LSAEHPVRGEFADYGLRIDQQLVAFVEMKRATTKLGLRHLRQVELYAMHEGVEWVVLTNGANWQVYHLTAGLPIVVDLAFDINLVDENLSPAHKVDKLFYLSKESMKRRQIDELWRMQAATSPKQLVAALLSKPVVTALHREVWRRTRERVEEKELTRLLKDTVFRPDALT
jgi:predicted type IV restriction endonuclease